MADDEDVSLEALISKESIDIATPLIRQFLILKKEHKDKILLYRVGEFYEMLFHDAIAGSKILDLKLTKRGNHMGKPVKLCGVPARSINFYLEKLASKGIKVAVCEQTQSTGKLMERNITKIITAGSIIDGNLLDSKTSNYLAAIYSVAKKNKNIVTYVSWAEVSTGELWSATIEYEDSDKKLHNQSDAAIHQDKLNNFLTHLDPKEILVSKTSAAYQYKLNQALTARISKVDEELFNAKPVENILQETFKVDSLEMFGDFSAGEKISMVAILRYLAATQGRKKTVMEPPKKYNKSNVLHIDAASRESLELLGRRNSLKSVLNICVTSCGSRCLDSFIKYPLVNIESINRRLNFVEYFLQRPKERGAIRALLSNLGDPQRALNRLALGSYYPRDLWFVQDALGAIIEMKGSSEKYGNLSLFHDMSALQDLYSKLKLALMPQAPMGSDEGGLIKTNFDARLKHARLFASSLDRDLGKLEEKYQTINAVKRLKITFHSQLGAVVEVSQKDADKIRPEFIHRQSISSTARFVTKELTELASGIEQAQKDISVIEQEIFEELIYQVLINKSELKEYFDSVARLDVFCSLAELASNYGYCRPVMNEGGYLEIIAGRHPVIEQHQKAKKFIANDIKLGNLSGSDQGSKTMMIITGPNMAGKSTYLRQTAIIVIMAQIGSFVPASSAKIGIADKIMCRIGANDDIASGKSTFLVEMIETATILNQATEKSLVIIDELGRGTGTSDGFALAKAVSEFLIDKIACRTLFATHIHELCPAIKEKKAAILCCLEGEKTEKGISFNYKMKEGVAKHSYGIEVAKMAGLPKEVIEQAQKTLKKF